MEVFFHHIYEYQKGLRNLILHTTTKGYKYLMQSKLEHSSIAYFIQPIDEEKINIYFGDNDCIEIIKHMNKENLTELNEEEDFMLGIMLGYDRKLQCERYLKRKVIKPKEREEREEKVKSS